MLACQKYIFLFWLADKWFVEEGPRKHQPLNKEMKMASNHPSEVQPHRSSKKWNFKQERGIHLPARARRGWISGRNLWLLCSGERVPCPSAPCLPVARWQVSWTGVRVPLPAFTRSTSPYTPRARGQSSGNPRVNLRGTIVTPPKGQTFIILRVLCTLLKYTLYIVKFTVHWSVTLHMCIPCDRHRDGERKLSSP